MRGSLVYFSLNFSTLKAPVLSVLSTLRTVLLVFLSTCHDYLVFLEEPFPPTARAPPCQVYMCSCARQHSLPEYLFIIRTNNASRGLERRFVGGRDVGCLLPALPLTDAFLLHPTNHTAGGLGKLANTLSLSPELLFCCEASR